jgi:ribonuclease HI
MEMGPPLFLVLRFRALSGKKMANKKFYAILAGRKPGIYTAWPDAEAQVKGFPQARFKGFATREEAEKWMRQSGPPQAAGRKKAVKSAGTHSRREGEVIIYTDGGALNNPGPGGYGVVQMHAGVKKELTGGYRLTTNNRMELMGCIVALRQLEHSDKPITLRSDSSYVVNGINKGWARNWRRNGWIKSDKRPALNRDLWAELLDLTQDLDIVFEWVKGHAGNPLNERCDELAVAAAHRPDLPVDKGYEGHKASGQADGSS